MLAITCAKCGRRFTPTEDEIKVYLSRGKGQKHTLVACPHCGKDSKIDTQRLEQSVRHAPAAPE